MVMGALCSVYGSLIICNYIICNYINFLMQVIWGDDAMILYINIFKEHNLSVVDKVNQLIFAVLTPGPRDSFRARQLFRSRREIMAQICTCQTALGHHLAERGCRRPLDCSRVWYYTISDFILFTYTKPK